VTPTAQQVPVVATEIGERDQGSSLVDSFVQWANPHHVGYLGWEYSRPYASTLIQVFTYQAERNPAP
jgi:hypothetical protein